MMPGSEPVYVVIPAYNEGAVLANTVLEVASKGYTVVVVDDGSTDTTPAILARLPVVTIRHPINLGQGAALQTGFEFCKACNAAVTVTFDADGQHDPSQIPNLVVPILLGEAEVVLGSRFLRASDVRLVPLPRRLMLRAAVLLSWLLTGLRLSDTHNGFRALSLRALRKVNLRENGFAHATEILTIIRRAGLSYREAAVTVHYSEYSLGKGQRILNAINILADLLLSRLFR